QELIDAPAEIGAVDRAVDAEAPHAGEPEERVGRVPRAVLDHPLAPLAAELDLLLELKRRGGPLDLLAVEVADCDRLAEPRALARLELVGRERDVRDHPAARLEDADALRERRLEVDVYEH